MLKRTTGFLADRGCDTPRLDAELLLADVLGVERITLYTEHDRPLTTVETDTYRRAVARRGAREPVAYIVGRRGFRRIELAVSPDVLVPRPETEALVEWALEVAPQGGTVVDWGTGSGAIALALVDERPDLIVTGIDVSPDALTMAQRNDGAKRVEWLVSAGFAALSGRTFDVIVANPPYLADAELATVAPELGFEPRGALVSGPSGLEAYEGIAADAPRHLNPGGRLLCEIGHTQQAAVTELLRSAGFVDIESRPDLAGIVRVVGGTSG